jgi:hypothetical protein
VGSFHFFEKGPVHRTQSRFCVVSFFRT